MIYIEVLLADQSFHGQEALTYSSEEKVQKGQIVLVSLRNKVVLGIVTAIVSRPSFALKPIKRIITQVPLPIQSLELLTWLREYYPAPWGSLTQQFLPSGLKQEARRPKLIISSKKSELLPSLTKEQQAATKTIEEGSSPSYLLHGNTGTGKTRVYLELAQKQLQTSKSALILTPEISLTPQLEHDFTRYVQAPVFVIHSQLSPAARRDLWLQILLSTEPIVVIGPRSALFSPIDNLGLIVIDEAHESAYKQEQAPYYHAIRVAAKLAQFHEAKLILGSATPTVTDYYIAEAKKTPIIRMQQLPLGDHTKTTVEVINLRDKDHFTHQSHLSNELLEATKETLHKKEQALIFLNRRGTARLVLCEVCGWQALCPNCDVPLTYHADSHNMRCHTCGYKAQTPTDCPVCHSTDIVFKSIGTKSIFEELQKEFPKAKIQRFDTDNLKAERFEQHYQAVKAGDVDILVGTQLLTKGLDLPKLSLVGVVLADTALYFPDFTAEEHTYQMVSQVVGRIGRGHRHGKAVIQTYNPDSPAIKAALTKDWPTFYKAQLKERQEFLFPPYCYLLKLSVSRATQKGAIQAADKLIEILKGLHLHIQIIGPSPAFHEKQAGHYLWQIVIKSKQRGALLNIIPALPSGWTYDIDPTNLL